jgi:hypothetical protein
MFYNSSRTNAMSGWVKAEVSRFTSIATGKEERKLDNCSLTYRHLAGETAEESPFLPV